MNYTTGFGFYRRAAKIDLMARKQGQVKMDRKSFICKKMSKYFILGQIAALEFYKDMLKPQRMDLKNRYLKALLSYELEINRLKQMLIDNK